MEDIYNLVDVIWAELVIIIGVAWAIFKYFKNQSYAKENIELKAKLSRYEKITSDKILKLNELESLIGEVKEISTGYKSTEVKRNFRSKTCDKLTLHAGYFGMHPDLMQSIRDFNQYSSIMAEEDPHEGCREEVMKYYSLLLSEIENVRDSL